MNIFNDFDPIEAESYINKLLKENDITVTKRSRSACGTAWVVIREIKIPHPTNEENFAVALHEIGHFYFLIHNIVHHFCHPLMLFSLKVNPFSPYGKYSCDRYGISAYYYPGKLVYHSHVS